MSKKTLITILFITITLVFIVVVTNNKSISHLDSYKYSLVNTTNDKNIKETSDKLDDKIENIILDNNLNNNNANNKTDEVNNLQSVIEQRNYDDTVSRSLEVDREKIIRDNKDIQNNIQEISTTSDRYVDTLSEKVLKKEEYIHGVKISTYSNITYDLYSNGFKEITNSIESKEIDNSKYNGNTQTLQIQAKENSEIYREKINEVLNLTNQYRSEVGLNNLVLDERLCLAASVRALEMSYTEKLTHVRPDGAKCFIVLEDLNINYNSAGENIADGFKYSENVCTAWKNSQGHYQNIICKKYNKIGVGIAQSLNGKYYWVQIFSN